MPPNMPGIPMPPLILAMRSRSSSFRRVSASISSSSSSSGSRSCWSPTSSSWAGAAAALMGSDGCKPLARSSSSSTLVDSPPASSVSPAPDWSASLASLSSSPGDFRSWEARGGRARSVEARSLEAPLATRSKLGTSLSSGCASNDSVLFLTGGRFGFSFWMAAALSACSCCCLCSKAIRSLRLTLGWSWTSASAGGSFGGSWAISSVLSVAS